jgi:hypothetical protein
MVNFVITNISNSSVTYQGTTITPNSSYPVTSNQTNYATDGLLLSDLVVGNIVVTIGTTTLSGPQAATLMVQMTLISFSGISGQAVPQRALLVGSSDSGNNLKNIRIDDSGNLYSNPQPVYNSTLPSPSDGARVDAQSNQFGETSVQFRNKYRNVTGNTTVTVKSGTGRLHGIMINKNWTSGTCVIYDNTSGSGTVIATIDCGTPSGGLLSSSGLPSPAFIGPLGLEFSTGLTVVTSGSTSNNLTFLYQ